MLLMTVSSNIISTGTVTPNAVSSNVISLVINPGLPQYGVLVVGGLIILLSLKEVISESKKWNYFLSDAFNLAIVPLLFSFAGIVIYKVTTII